MTDQQRNAVMVACVLGIIILCSCLVFMLGLGA